jgi:SAM-dependent methyltransferase
VATPAEVVLLRSRDVDIRDADASEQEEILWALEENAPRYNDWLLSRALPHTGAHVLEVGAGIGTFTLLLAARGIRVSALEPDESLVSILEKRTRNLGGVDVLRRDIEGLTAERFRGRVDSVICFNVLEHIADDGTALRKMTRCLKKNGQLMLLAPAHRFLFGETDRAVDHQRRYDARGLSRLLSGVGLDLMELRYVNPVGAAGWFVSSCLFRRRTLPSNSLKLYEHLVPTLRQFDRLRLPLGLSLWVRARLSPAHHQ